MKSLATDELCVSKEINFGATALRLSRPVVQFGVSCRRQFLPNELLGHGPLMDGQICPVEVKSGAAGRLRSLRLLMDTYPNCRTGYVLSCAPYTESPEQKLVFLPLYYAGTLRA